MICAANQNQHGFLTAIQQEPIAQEYSFSFYALFDPQDDSQLIFLLSLFINFIIVFLSEFNIKRKFWFEELSKILYFITVVIYLIIVTFLFILAYYILCNTYLHIISYILFLIILISLFQQRRILRIIERIQSKITDYLVNTPV